MKAKEDLRIERQAKEKLRIESEDEWSRLNRQLAKQTGAELVQSCIALIVSSKGSRSILLERVSREHWEGIFGAGSLFERSFTL